MPSAPSYMKAMMLSEGAPLLKSNSRAMLLLLLERNQHAKVRPALLVVNVGTFTYCELEATNWRLPDPTLKSAVSMEAPYIN